MPKRSSSRKMVVRKGRRGQKGAGIFGSIGKFFKSAVGFLRKHKVLSTLGKVATPFAGPYSGAVTGATGVASALGFGRRRRRLKGLGLQPAGGSRHRAHRKCR